MFSSGMYDYSGEWCFSESIAKILKQAGGNHAAEITTDHDENDSVVGLTKTLSSLSKEVKVEE
jgi:hypothetical protein